RRRPPPRRRHARTLPRPGRAPREHPRRRAHARDREVLPLARLPAGSREGAGVGAFLMATTTTTLPGRFHDAVERWRERFLPDYGLLLESWEKFFPNDEPFRLCAHRECGMC